MLSQDCPISLTCDVLGCARSSYYYQPKQRDETEIKAAIDAVAAEWPTYGFATLQSFCSKTLTADQMAGDTWVWYTERK
jgi:hypothetical protein